MVATDALKQQVARHRAAFPDVYNNVVVEDLIAEGDKVVARIATRGTHQGEYRGIPPTSKLITAAGIVYRLAGGKIVEHWTCADSLGMLQQLSAVIPAPARAG